MRRSIVPRTKAATAWSSRQHRERASGPPLDEIAIDPAASARRIRDPDPLLGVGITCQQLARRQSKEHFERAAGTVAHIGAFRGAQLQRQREWHLTRARCTALSARELSARDQCGTLG